MSDYKQYLHEYDALRTMIDLSDKSFATCALHLWPKMKLDSAVARLRTCLSKSGDQRLTFGQIIELMNFTGRFDPLHFACDETLHTRPARRAKEDIRLDLLSEIRHVSAQFERLAQSRPAWVA